MLPLYFALDGKIDTAIE